MTVGGRIGTHSSYDIDLMRLADEDQYDSGIIASQDWDFGSAVSLAKTIACSGSRNVVFESAFPDDDNTSRRGISGRLTLVCRRLARGEGTFETGSSGLSAEDSERVGQ